MYLEKRVRIGNYITLQEQV